MEVLATFWQWVGALAGVVILALAAAFIWWRRRRRAAGLYVTGPTQGTPPTPPKPNGEDRGA